MNPLKKELQEQNKSEKWLADESNLDKTLIHDFCVGGKVPSLHQIFAIALALNVNPYHVSFKE